MCLCSPFKFETPLFSGQACVWIRGLPGSPAAEDLFAGRQRRSLVTVQGRFRQPVPVDDLVTGQEFGPLKGLPPAWLLGVLFKVGLKTVALLWWDAVISFALQAAVHALLLRHSLPPACSHLPAQHSRISAVHYRSALHTCCPSPSPLAQVARALNPSIAFGPLSAPSMLMPVVAACSEMHAALAGAEPDPAGPPCEDLRAWDPALALPDGARALNLGMRCVPAMIICWAT